MNWFFLGFFLVLSLSCFALEIKYSEIVDPELHAANQRLLKEIVERELVSISPKTSPAEKGRILTRKNSEIAAQFLKSGFSGSAYSIPEANPHTLLSFDCFALWEGESIPATFLVYVWPSEEHARIFNSDHPKNTYYGSIIHSHPISCAFAVLDGFLIQENFVLSDPLAKSVHLIGEDFFHRLEGSVDDLKQPFIHRLYGKGSGKKPVLSLHVYGLSTEEKVMASFKETRALHSYTLETTSQETAR